MKASLPFTIVTIILALVLGSASGYGIAKTKSPSKSNTSAQKTANGETEVSSGIKDKNTFNTQAEGILKEGGLEGEGSFNLERPGGKTQTVYLTSSAVDLSEYVNKKVKVWGQTHKSEKAGWLMDVGYVELL